MSKLITLKIDVTKIDKSKLFKGAKGTYLDLDCWIDEDADEDWKKVSMNQSQSKEEREAKTPKNYVGNGSLKFGWDDVAPAASAAPVVDDEPFEF
jgi:hypothetical protein